MSGSRNNTHYGAGYSMEPTTAPDTVTMQIVPNSTQELNVPSNPEGVFAANPGSIAHGRNGTLWLKVTGTGNTGWQQISTGSAVPIQFTSNSGVAVPAANNLNVLGNNTQGINITGASDTLTVAGINASASQKGVASFDSTNFTATSGAITSNPITITAGTGLSGGGSVNLGGSVTLNAGPTVATTYVCNTGSATPALNVLNVLGDTAQGVSTSGASSTATVTVANATTSSKGVSSYNSTNFTVTAGNVTSNAITINTGTGLSGGGTVNLGGSITLSATTAPTNMVEQYLNLGITYSAGTFSITQADGSALSAGSPGYVRIPSGTAGQSLVYTITANQSFNDSTAGTNIGNNLFGLTTGIAYAQDIPFFIYAVANDAQNAVNFAISRVPHRTRAPASTNYAQQGSTLASTQGSFFGMGTFLTTDYDQNPCVCIGAFRMRYTGSNWTVQTLTNGNLGTSAGAIIQADGIGQFHDGSKFQVPTGQFGNASGKYFRNNGGTAPGFANAGLDYQIMRNGYIRANLNSDTTTSGSGSQELLFSLFYVSCHTGSIGTCSGGSGTGTFSASCLLRNSNFSTVVFPSFGFFLQNSSLSGNNFSLQLLYQADPN